MGAQRARAAALITIALLAVASAVLISGARLSRQDSGHVGVVRNGGPADNRKIRQILMPGQRISWVGLFSQSPREYPAAKVVLFYTVTSDARRGDRRDVDVVNVPTRDGVQVGLEATVFFHFVGESDLGLLQRFDQTFGTRQFPVAGSDKMLRPWDGEEGWAAMLDATFRPVLDNDLREEFGHFDCAELVASCSLVRRQSDLRRLEDTATANVAQIQQRINRSLQDDLRQTLGGDYFRDVRVRVARVTLPGNVQGAIDDVQAQYVAVNGAKAQVRRARFDAERKQLLAEVYRESPALARIDAISAAPKGATIVLSEGSGSSKAPGINVGGK
jgi:regulator of protease activity HflC (stomatin/prohibitin superfamily)